MSTTPQPPSEDLEDLQNLKTRYERLRRTERKEVVLGVVIGRLRIVKVSGKMVEAECICGKMWKGLKFNVSRGNTLSCGCYSKEVRRFCRKTHGHKSDGKVSKLYRAWQSMKTRCYLSLPVNHQYIRRGISVCPEWLNSFEAFAKHIGEPPSPNHTVERIDNSKGYEIGNVKWATRKEQGNNKINNRRLTYANRTLTIAQWADEIGISESCIRLRLKRGWSVEKTVTTPKIVP